MPSVTPREGGRAEASRTPLLPSPCGSGTSTAPPGGVRRAGGREGELVDFFRSTGTLGRRDGAGVDPELGPGTAACQCTSIHGLTPFLAATRARAPRSSPGGAAVPPSWRPSTRPWKQSRPHDPQLCSFDWHSQVRPASDSPRRRRRSSRRSPPHAHCRRSTAPPLRCTPLLPGPGTLRRARRRSTTGGPGRTCRRPSLPSSGRAPRPPGEAVARKEGKGTGMGTGEATCGWLSEPTPASTRGMGATVPRWTAGPTTR